MALKLPVYPSYQLPSSWQIHQYASHLHLLHALYSSEAPPLSWDAEPKGRPEEAWCGCSLMPL